ncbi:hypothetical protein PV350_41245 [Streptomyces sp. PA03-6a]|nr:hypothetical protein [Streptomyces sp. PA03-6a]
MGGVDWGDVPTWLGGVFAAGAAVAAFWTLASQRRQISEQQDFIAEQSATMSMERAELAALASERRWAQARKVRMKPGQGDGHDTESIPARLRPDRWMVDVENGSHAPIHDVRVRFGGAYEAAEVTDVAADRVSNDGGRQSSPVPLIGPGRTFRFDSPVWALRDVINSNPPHMFFTDDAGVRWHLSYGGKLEQHPENEPEQ